MMKRRSFRSGLAGCALLALGAVTIAGMAAAEPIDFFQVDGVSYDAAVPTPEEVIGWGLGDRPVRHDQLVSYLSQIADGSDRISVETIGYTHEHRPILFLSSPRPRTTRGSTTSGPPTWPHWNPVQPPMTDPRLSG